MAGKVARRWAGDPEELAGEGVLIALDALDAYRPATSTSLTTLVYQRLAWILPRIAAQGRKGADREHDHDAVGRLPERRHTKDDAVQAVELLLAELPESQREAVSLYFGVGRAKATLRQIGEALGLGLAETHAMLVAGMEALRDAARRIDLPDMPGLDFASEDDEPDEDVDDARHDARNRVSCPRSRQYGPTSVAQPDGGEMASCGQWPAVG